MRGVFRTQWSFFAKKKQLKAVNYFCKKNSVLDHQLASEDASADIYLYYFLKEWRQLFCQFWMIFYPSAVCFSKKMFFKNREWFR